MALKILNWVSSLTCSYRSVNRPNNSFTGSYYSSPCILAPHQGIWGFPPNIFCNILAANLANNPWRNPLFCSFVSFFIVSFFIISLTRFISKPDSSRDLTIFLVAYIYLVEIIRAVVPDPKILFWIAASVTGAANVKPNRTKALLANGEITFFSNGKPTGINDLRKLISLPFWVVFFLGSSFQ